MKPRFCPPRGPGSFRVENRVLAEMTRVAHQHREDLGLHGQGGVTHLASKAQLILSGQLPTFLLPTSGKKALALPISTLNKRMCLPDLPPNGQGQREGARSSGQADCTGGAAMVKELQMPALPVLLRQPRWEGDPGCCQWGGDDISSWSSERPGPSLPFPSWLLAGSRSCPPI